MKFYATAFLFFCTGFLFSVAARNVTFHTRENFSVRPDDPVVSPDKKLHLFFYPGVSFMNYEKQSGLLELSFAYSRLDTATGGLIPESFYYSKNGLTGNHSFGFPMVGMELKKQHFFLCGDLRIPKKNRSLEKHFSAGYEYRVSFTENPHHFSFFGALNGTAPNWMSSVFIRGDIGVEIYKPTWLLGELPVEDTSIFIMGYTIKKSNSNVRKVGIYYEEDIVALTPSFTCGFGTSENRINFALTFSPLIPIREKGGIRILYKKNNTGWLNPYTWFWYPYKSLIEPGQSGFVAKYDGETLSKTPFHLRGYELFLRISFRIR